MLEPKYTQRQLNTGKQRQIIHCQFIPLYTDETAKEDLKKIEIYTRLIFKTNLRVTITTNSGKKA